MGAANLLRHTRIAMAAVGACALAPAAAGAIAQPTYLDAGPHGGARSATVMLDTGDAFDSTRGYGWATAPESTFAHPSFDGVRSATLLDGVAGRDFTLRLDLAPGRWTLLLFLDDGYRDAHTVQIQINGLIAPHNPRAFGLEREPDKPPLNRYRVAQFVTAGHGATELRFIQPASHGARLLALHALPMDWAENETTEWIRRQVDDAGRHDFRASLDILQAQLDQFRERPELAACCTYWKAQLDLLAEAERLHRAAGWDEVSRQTRSSMFVRYKIAVALLDSLAEHPDGSAFPLRDRALWLRARLLYWIWLEQHLPGDERAYRADLALLRERYPHDPLIAMYGGERIVSGTTAGFTSRPSAPAWSIAQHEALQRLRDVAHYWIDQRQIPNGEFGGKTDDDVELLRWWPVLMFSGDRKAREGFRKLAEGVWFSPRMAQGFSKIARDVEHSAEFVADTVPMMALMSGEPKWLDRLAWSHRHMRDLWTGRNVHGDLLFKSAWIGATDILSEPPRNRDVSMNARAAKAVRYLAWLGHHADAARLLYDWSLAWAGAAARTDKGKPRGLFPASLRWPDAAINGDEPTWHRAEMFWDYYDWTGDGRLYDQLLFSWLGTRDVRLLSPLHDTLMLLQTHAGSGAAPDAPEGSPAWAAARLMQSGEFWNAATQWRLESGDTRFDGFLTRHGPPYLRFRLGGAADELARTITTTLIDVLRFNRPMRTSEVLFTDRVFVSRREGNVDGVDLLAAMLTGCHTAQGASPYYHVAWDEAPETFTALVTSAGPEHVATDVFAHQTGKFQVTARWLRLESGRYRITANTASGLALDQIATISPQDPRVILDLPGDVVCSVRIEREPSNTPFPPEAARARHPKTN